HVAHPPLHSFPTRRSSDLPLTAIHGYVRTLVRRFDDLSPDEIHMFLETIARQSVRMTRLVEDLLFVSKIEAGAIRLAVEEVDLRSESTRLNSSHVAISYAV